MMRMRLPYTRVWYALAYKIESCIGSECQILLVIERDSRERALTWESLSRDKTSGENIVKAGEP